VVDRVVGIRNEEEKKSDHGRIAFYEHGGKTGRAMIKYPGYKKNAQRYKHPLYQVWAKSTVYGCS
jgi:hypothetical protein